MALREYLIFVIFFLTSLSATAQNVISDTITKSDSDSLGVMARIDQILKDGVEKSRTDYLEEKNNMRRERMLDEIQRTTLRVKTLLKHGFDSARINTEINSIRKWAEIANEGVINNSGGVLTHRNLTTTSKILRELLSQANNRKSFLDAHQKELQAHRLFVDSLFIDSSFQKMPSDSATLLKYLSKYLYVAKQIHPIDSSLTATIGEIYLQQARVNQSVYQLHGNIEEVENNLKILSSRIFDREFSNLHEPGAPHESFSRILSISTAKDKLAFYFYVKNHSGRVILVLLLVLASTLFIRSLKAILEREELTRKDFAGQLVLRFPFLSAIILVFSLFQFIFPDPPFIVNIILWCVPALALTVVMNNFISRYWMNFWIVILVLFFAACFLNLILQPSNTERWMILILSIIGVGVGTFYLFNGKLKLLREKLIIYFIAFEVIFELAAVIANFMGRYNLGKSLMTIGFLNVIIGLLFLWIVRLINEGLTLASSVYTKQERKLFFINFERVGDKVPFLLYAILVIAWVILVGRNFYAFRLIAEPFKDFFVVERTIGSYSFTIANILVFFIVMFFAVLTSKIISFFGSDMNVHSRSSEIKERKAGLGSWLLLIRVTIICVGLFLALSASGFPMDRITIILGALGVGVGFGLQGLVGHLVSGLVIAFEKPVNVGDIVEISGQVGTVKSIGFRSSVISSSNGADIVIPNGDLLNAHLINWTLAGNKRLLDISIYISSETDLHRMEHLLLELMGKEERILKYPAPSVLLDKFENGNILVKIFFWVKDYREGVKVKSDVIESMDEIFKSNGIVIPVPQQEIIVQTNDFIPRKT